MTDPDREDPWMQVDPVLILSDGRATFGQKLVIGIAAIVVVLGTLYGLVHQQTSPTFLTVASNTVLPETVGQAK